MKDNHDRRQLAHQQPNDLLCSLSCGQDRRRTRQCCLDRTSSLPFCSIKLSSSTVVKVSFHSLNDMRKLASFNQYWNAVVRGRVCTNNWKETKLHTQGYYNSLHHDKPRSHSYSYLQYTIIQRSCAAQTQPTPAKIAHSKSNTLFYSIIHTNVAVPHQLTLHFYLLKANNPSVCAIDKVHVPVTQGFVASLIPIAA